MSELSERISGTQARVAAERAERVALTRRLREDAMSLLDLVEDERVRVVVGSLTDSLSTVTEEYERLLDAYLDTLSRYADILDRLE